MGRANCVWVVGDKPWAIHCECFQNKPNCHFRLIIPTISRNIKHKLFGAAPACPHACLLRLALACSSCLSLPSLALTGCADLRLARRRT